jgi:hypothetical protein
MSRRLLDAPINVAKRPHDLPKAPTETANADRVTGVAAGELKPHRLIRRDPQSIGATEPTMPIDCRATKQAASNAVANPICLPPNRRVRTASYLR